MSPSGSPIGTGIRAGRGVKKALGHDLCGDSNCCLGGPIVVDQCIAHARREALGG